MVCLAGNGTRPLRRGRDETHREGMTLGVAIIVGIRQRLLLSLGLWRVGTKTKDRREMVLRVLVAANAAEAGDASTVAIVIAHQKKAFREGKRSERKGCFQLQWIR